jgi:hypothetical protein
VPITGIDFSFSSLSHSSGIRWHQNLSCNALKKWLIDADFGLQRNWHLCLSLISVIIVTLKALVRPMFSLKVLIKQGNWNTQLSVPLKAYAP